MCRTTRSCFTVIAVLLACTISSAAIKQGKVVALTLQQGDGAGNWAPGKLTLIDIPSLQKTTLVDKNCWGPCFSPRGDSIAYVTTSTTSTNEYYIYTLAVGGSAQPVSTGIKISMTPPNDWGWPPGAHPALFWIRKSDGDWFYWVQRIATGCGVWRAKLGTSTTPEFVYGTPSTNAGGFHWGAFDKTATRVVATQNWGVYKIDLVSRTHTIIDDGCNPAVSPSGNLMMNNGGTKRCEYSSICTYEHCGGQILNWSDFSCSRGLIYPGNSYDVACNGDMNKWSHYDEDIIMFRAFDQGNLATCAVADHGVIANRVTDERLSLGPYVGWDFFPGTVGPDTTTREPTFNPASGALNAGTTTVTLTSATAGATIRYTTDGSAPTQTHGTAIASGGTLPVTLTAGQSIRVRAIAYAAGKSPSTITEANYSVPVPTTYFTITSPNGGETYRAGDSITIAWTTASGYTSSGIVVTYSLNGGIDFIPITARALAAGTALCGWRIPAGTPATSEALIEIHDYAASDHKDLSNNVFTITPSGSAIVARGSGTVSSGISVHREGRYVVVNHVELKSVSILDAKGRTVSVASNVAGDKVMRLRLPGCSGTYLLMIRTAAGTYQRMISSIAER